MPTTPRLSPTRRQTCVLILAAAASPASAARRKVVTILGDSITAGYGLPAAQALAAQLERALAMIGAPAAVRGSGVSGDTTGGGLARVAFSVQSDTDLCVVALGGNDLLQGLDPTVTKANLLHIVAWLKARRIGVLLAGLRAPAAIGADYARDFNAVFPAVAKSQAVALYPDLLAGVEGMRALNQGDGIHPNAAGTALIARCMAPVVAHGLNARP